MDIRKIKKLIKLTHDSNITKLEISEGNKIIRITRAISNIALDTTYVEKQKKLATQEYVSTNKTTLSTIKEHIIRSPMVGIFYITPKPNTKPFVSIGQSIKIGDILCIIEAMKIMNQIQSDVSGKIKKILCNNGQPIEFDEELFIVE